MKFEVTVDQANLILDALSDRPYRQVSGLIQSLFDQADKQLGEVDERPDDVGD